MKISKSINSHLYYMLIFCLMSISKEHYPEFNTNSKGELLNQVEKVYDYVNYLEPEKFYEQCEVIDSFDYFYGFNVFKAGRSKSFALEKTSQY